MDFEMLVKVLLLMAGAIGIPVAAYAAVMATKAIWGRPQPAAPALGEEVEALRARLASLEGVEERMAELEERLDFAERMLAQQRDPARLGPGKVGS